jgi:2-methylaconitate cis-trans-isomerase PrpF
VETVRDRIGRSFRVSIVDAGAPTVFIDARDLGLGADDLLGDRFGADLVGRLQGVRAAAAVGLGLVSEDERAAMESPTQPKLYVVHPSGDDEAGPVDDGEAGVDMLARGLTMGRLHKAYATTAAIATAVAARIPGTIVEQIARAAAPPGAVASIRIRHPSGVMPVEVEVKVGHGSGQPELRRAVVVRTARRLSRGEATVPWSAVFGAQPVPAHSRTSSPHPQAIVAIGTSSDSIERVAS